MKYNFIFFLYLMTVSEVYAQDFGGNKVGLGNFIKRMYTVSPFNGVKLFQSEDGKDYLVSIVEIKNDLAKPENVQSRIASIKAKAYASQYLNGSSVSTDVIIVTKEERAKYSIISKTEMQEILRESSSGFIEGMELLTKFVNSDEKQAVYIYYWEVNKR